MMNIPQGNETVTSVAGIGLVVRLSFHCAGKMAKQNGRGLSLGWPSYPSNGEDDLGRSVTAR